MKEVRKVCQASCSESFDYTTVRAVITGLGMIPKSLVTEVAHGDAHRAGDYVLDLKDYRLNEHAKRALKEWIREKHKNEKAPFSHGRSYFQEELLNLPLLVWDSGIAGILTYASVAYDAWRQREGI